MVKREFLSYEAPVVEIVEVEVEKGFATTGDDWTSSDGEE